jgi:GT2 family glycosyltransferase
MMTEFSGEAAVSDRDCSIPTLDCGTVSAPRVAVIIPTYNRGTRIFETLRRINSCDPPPHEIWVHVDAADGKLEAELAREFPTVHILTSKQRLGPGGGRHRCLLACSADYAVSFDDDSYPVDADFFKVVSSILQRNPRIAVLEAQIWQREEPEIARSQNLAKTTGFTGCGHAMRVAAYRALPGYLSSPVPYNIEETDFALQLFCADWQIYKSDDLRVFHDTDLKHHQQKEIVAGTISNVALFAFVNYPIILWPYGVLQLTNTLLFCIRDGRVSGILPGLAQVPVRCFRHRHDRRPLPVRKILRYLRSRRACA